MIDDELRSLHIRCGSDIRDKMTAAGFTGDFLEYADPVCEGPVLDVPDLIDWRARYLAKAYGLALAMTESQITSSLRDADRRLAEAHRYERVVLWFEHDSFDQLVLARLLARLAETTIPTRLELICIDRHPDVPRFNGLGQLTPEALVALFPMRLPVTQAQIALGQSIWTALRQPDPTALQTIAQSGTPALPVAARALWRHLQELPGAQDGLSLTQRLILTILNESPARIGQVFATLVDGREPLVWMGDISLQNTVEAMARTDEPVLTIEPGEKPFARTATITETGRSVLGGNVDYLLLAPAERWIGGIAIAPGQPVWRFDSASNSVCR